MEYMAAVESNKKRHKAQTKPLEDRRYSLRYLPTVYALAELSVYECLDAFVMKHDLEREDMDELQLLLSKFALSILTALVSKDSVPDKLDPRLLELQVQGIPMHSKKHKTQFICLSLVAIQHFALALGDKVIDWERAVANHGSFMTNFVHSGLLGLVKESSGGNVLDFSSEEVDDLRRQMKNFRSHHFESGECLYRTEVECDGVASAETNRSVIGKYLKELQRKLNDINGIMVTDHECSDVLEVLEGL